MKVVKAYKYRLKTNRETESILEQYCGSARFIWNKVLAINLSRLESKQRILWYGEMSFWLSLWKQSEEYSFLNNCHSQILQQKLKDLEKAFKDCFDKNQPGKRMPTWRKKSIHNSFRYPQGFKIDNNRVYLPKIGWVNFIKSRDIVGLPKNITISKHGKYWYISVQTEQEVKRVCHSSTSEVGIDLGISKFVALSDGSLYGSVNAFAKNRTKLAALQRKLRLKNKFSNNWHKQQERIRSIHTKIANIRKDYLHKLSSEICKNHATIYIEDLRIVNMSKSARGSIEAPGTKVKAKSGLNRSILDQGWGEFSRQLHYKSAWLGGTVITVNAKYTSQTCSCCKYRDQRNRVSQSSFQCLKCGYQNNADINAAKNIMAVGQTVSACGESAIASSVKQELLEGSNLFRS